MSFFELLSIVMALLALAVSAITAYETFYSKFKCEFFVKPRIVLTQISGSPALVVGCEIMNTGTRFGAIDDIVLAVRYKQNSTRSIDRYTFFPKLMRDTYSVFENYRQESFEPFQTIALTARSRFAKYIVFTSANDNFKPSTGEISVELFFRVSGGKSWKNSMNVQILEIDRESLELWIDSNNPKSIMLETMSNYKERDRLMENLFK
jgi:hypothetical protein